MLVAFGGWLFLRSPTEIAEQPFSMQDLGEVYGPLVVSPDQAMFGVSGPTDIFLHDAKTLDQRRFFPTPKLVSSMMFTPDGTTLVSASNHLYDESCTIHVWSVSDEKLLRMFVVPIGFLQHVAIAPNGATLASILNDRVVQLFSVSNGQLLHTLNTSVAALENVEFSPDGTILAITVDEGIELWRVSDGQLIRTLNTGAVRGIAFAPDGVTLVSIGYGTTVRVWNVGDGRLVHTLNTPPVRKKQGLTMPVTVAFSPDGATLASVSADGIVQLWSLDNGRTLYTLEIPLGETREVRFAPDGTTLASVPSNAFADTPIRLWRVSDGQLFRTLATSQVRDVGFILNGTTLASLSPDGIIRLWLVNTQ